MCIVDFLKSEWQCCIIFLQKLAIVDYGKTMRILAVIQQGEKEKILGLGRYGLNTDKRTANIALAGRDHYHNRKIRTELFSHLVYLAKKQGLLGFVAEVSMDNRIFEK